MMFGKSRLEAFSDGVIAIIITIMVLELKVPHSGSLEALLPLSPIFFSYVLSFMNIAIYWHNHHHLFQVTKRIDARVMWANTHLLFWLSLLPFTTGWLGENNVALLPAAVYGVNLLAAGAAYSILQSQIIRANGGKNSHLAKAFGKDWKGKAALLIYSVGVGVTYFSPWLACGLYLVVALMWFIPDTRIEQMVVDVEHTTQPKA
jgi:uncharacterized membrane protein